MLRLGYAGVNTELRTQHILTDRTAREATVLSLGSGGRAYLADLFRRNLEDLAKIIEWNIAHGILFYRISSDIAPHIANPNFVARRADERSLAYSLEDFRPLLRKIGARARQVGMRLTMHPAPFITISSPDAEVILRSRRTLWYHAQLLDLMGLDLNSVVILHGGGTYGDREATMARWVDNYVRLPVEIRRRTVLENDERSYSLADVLRMSRAVGERTGTPVPVVFDIFHHKLHHPSSPKPEKFMPEVIATWGARRVKMHISEQKPGAQRGSHSDFVRIIPRLLLDFPREYGRDLDLTIEAKAKEQAVLFLMKKYKIGEKLILPSGNKNLREA
jgi:UV DNA damage endonuclease